MRAPVKIFLLGQSRHDAAKDPCNSVLRNLALQQSYSAKGPAVKPAHFMFTLERSTGFQTAGRDAIGLAQLSPWAGAN
jgi:hypothetical protein